MLLQPINKSSGLGIFRKITGSKFSNIIRTTSQFRTEERSPSKHTDVNLNKFYTISPDTRKVLFQQGGFPQLFVKHLKSFGETCLMVREPAIEIINCIQNSNLSASRATTRYVLYGKNGTGKSLTLAHVLHYGMENDFLLVHVPWAPNWYKRPKEVANSTVQEGMIDLPVEAASWLIHFKLQNAHILPKLELICSKDYTWSKREVTPAGAPIIQLIDHGISRIKFASSTIAALLQEIKQYSSQGKCKTMVAIDGYNALFHYHTKIKNDDKKSVEPNQITLTQPFIDITDYNWSNGVCILTVDQLASSQDHSESELPRYLLGRKGFEHLDPFVPIAVRNYNDKEISTCIDYYLDRRLIQITEKGFDKEIKFLSGQNPFKMMQLCSTL